MSESDQIHHFAELRRLNTDEQLDNVARMVRDIMFGFIGEEWRERIKGMTVLDVGCGPVPLRAGAKKEIGLDPLLKPYMDMKYHGKHYDGMMLIEGVASKIDMDDESVDFVHCKSALEYMSDWRESLVEMKRVLKRGGHLYMMYNSFQRDGINLNLLKDVDMRETLKSMGFIVLKHSRDESNRTAVFARKL